MKTLAQKYEENNTHHKPGKRNKSGHVGVFWRKESKQWIACVYNNGESFLIGRYENKEDAVQARKQAVELYKKPKDNCESEITQALVRKYFDYNYKTGELIWKKKRSNRNKIGSIAGSMGTPPNDYLSINFFGKTYGVHRIIWLYVYGELPKENIDHINHNKIDNRISNLREANQSENTKNRRMGKNNTSGVVGIYWRADNKRWQAAIRIEKKNIHLGFFTNKQDAIAARKQAEKLYGFHENHGKAA